MTVLNPFSNIFNVDDIPFSNSLQTILQVIRCHLGMEVAFISRVEGNSRVFELVDHDPVSGLLLSPGDTGPAESSFCKRVIEGSLPELMRDAMDFAEARSVPETHSWPIGGHLSVPLELEDGEIYGTLCCFSRRPAPDLNDRALEVMRAFAKVVSMHLSGRKTNRLEEREAKQRILDVMDSDGLNIVFQPIVGIESRHIVGYEALARFNSPVRRPPNVWFREAEKAGLGTDLELFAMKKALGAAKNLPGDCFLSLNASPETILSGRIQSALAEADLQRLVIEVTEHSGIERYDDVAKTLDSFRAEGMRLAVDDAGAGYASFRHILALAPDIIKLDMSIVRNIDMDFRKQALGKSMVTFAEATDSDVVAEGVETGEEFNQLQLLGVHKVQGYFTGRPKPQAW